MSSAREHQLRLTQPECRLGRIYRLQQHQQVSLLFGPGGGTVGTGELPMASAPGIPMPSALDTVSNESTSNSATVRAFPYQQLAESA